ncbi:MAG: leucine-rich repeat domain-containing protein [Treponema sp.]|nr:leucine-rich repeat domain-containing protein [Treponema sp.]
MNRKCIIGIAFVFLMTFSAYTQQYTPETDFTVTQNRDGTSVTITEYTGTSQTVNIPPRIQQLTVTHIGDSTYNRNTETWSGSFAGKNLTSVTIPDSVTSIGNSAFRNNKLTSVTIPDSVTSIGEMVFAENLQLSAITVGTNNPNYCSIDGVLYNKTGTMLIFWPRGKTPINIPKSVTSIGVRAFLDNQLTSVTIPNNVTTIGDFAFGLNRLTKATIGNSVTEIGAGAFGFNNLTSVTIPNSVTSIGGLAFCNNQLTKVTLGKSVISIEGNAFSSNRLTSITIPNSVTSIGGNAFGENPLSSVTIGANVQLDYSSFPNNFETFYTKQGKRAGTYVYRNGAWSRR